MVIMTFDPVSLRKFWLAEYAPEMMERESGRMPDLTELAAQLTGKVRIDELSIPADCADGFFDRGTERRSVERLSVALEDGSWDDRFGELRSMSMYPGSLRLVTWWRTARSRVSGALTLELVLR